MELFTIILPDEDPSDAQQLHSRFEHAFLSAPSDLNVSFRQTETAVKCLALLPRFQLARDAGKVYRLAGKVLEQFVVQHWEMQIVEGLLKRDYGYGDKRQVQAGDASWNSGFDLEGVKEYCREVLYPFKDEDWHRQADLRGNGFGVRFAEYLECHAELNLQGFLRFRLKDYMSELKEMIDYAIDEMILDRQYQEFVSVLKYFVSHQEIKTPAVHIIHDDHRQSAILNEKMEPLEMNDLDDHFVLECLERDLNLEDLLISTLLNVSPRKIYVHTRDSSNPVVRTVKQIFEDRVIICTYCSVCKPRLGEFHGTRKHQT